VFESGFVLCVFGSGRVVFAVCCCMLVCVSFLFLFVLCVVRALVCLGWFGVGYMLACVFVRFVFSVCFACLWFFLSVLCGFVCLAWFWVLCVFGSGLSGLECGACLCVFLSTLCCLCVLCVFVCFAWHGVLCVCLRVVWAAQSVVLACVSFRVFCVFGVS